MTIDDLHISLLNAKKSRRQCNWFLCYGKVHKNGIRNLCRVPGLIVICRSPGSFGETLYIGRWFLPGR